MNRKKKPKSYWEMMKSDPAEGLWDYVEGIGDVVKGFLKGLEEGKQKALAREIMQAETEWMLHSYQAESETVRRMEELDKKISGEMDAIAATNDLLIRAAHFDKLEEYYKELLDLGMQMRLPNAGKIKEAIYHNRGAKYVSMGLFYDAHGYYDRAIKYLTMASTHHYDKRGDYFLKRARSMSYIERGLLEENPARAISHFTQAANEAKMAAQIADPSEMLEIKSLISFAEALVSICEGMETGESLHFEEAARKMDHASTIIPNAYYSLKLMCEGLAAKEDSEMDKLIERALDAFVEKRYIEWLIGILMTVLHIWHFETELAKRSSDMSPSNMDKWKDRINEFKRDLRIQKKKIEADKRNCFVQQIRESKAKDPTVNRIYNELII
jgi:tetratricopeptide (TPR) repeat protein